MIYDPITRQRVELVGRYPVQNYVYRFGRKHKADGTRFVKVKYHETLPGFSGGFVEGTERDVDVNNLVADGGAKEIHEAYEALPEIP